MKNPDVRLIAAMGRSRQIGLAGRMPWPKEKGDLPEFQTRTAGAIVVMGMSTILPIWRRIKSHSRVFVGISRGSISVFHIDPYWEEPFFMRFGSMSPAQVLDFIVGMHPGRVVWIAGGAKIYQAFAHLCSSERSVVNLIDYDGEADTFMPPLPWET